MDLPSLTKVLIFFEERFTQGRSALFGDIQNIANILVALEIVFAGMYLALGSSADIKGVARKILIIGFFFYVIRSYSDILRWLVNGFLYAGAKAGSGTNLNVDTLKDPAAVFRRGMEITKPVANKLFAEYNSSFLGFPSLDSLLLLFCLVVSVFSFAIISIQIFITYLEYLLVATAGFILIPFGIFKPTAFLAERVFGAIIAFGVKLMILALIVGVSDAFLKTLVLPETASWQQAVELSVIALALAFLALHAPGVAQSLLSGSPNLSFGTIGAAAVGAGSVASSAARVSGAAGGFAATNTLAAAGAMHAGGTAAVAGMGSSSEGKSLAGKVSQAAKTGATFAGGAVSGLAQAATSEFVGKLAYGSVGAPEGSRAYRESIGDRSLRQPGAGGNPRGSSGVVGHFNAGRFSVPQYRKMDAESREEKSKTADSKDAKRERSAPPGPSENSSSTENTQSTNKETL